MTVRARGTAAVCAPHAGRRWLFLLALAVTSPVWASLGKDYDTAILQVERENYEKAIPLLEEVISEVPASLPRIRLYGMRFAPYTPHYYLGLAHYRLGNCEDALNSWAVEARFQVLAGKNAESMVSGKKDCETRLVQAGKELPAPAMSAADNGNINDAALREITDAFFRGAYEQVARFDPTTLSDPASRGQAWIYRAASQYTLYILGGEANGESLADVRGSLASARASDPNLVIDRNQFSPKFLKLLDQGDAR